MEEPTSSPQPDSPPDENNTPASPELEFASLKEALQKKEEELRSAQDKLLRAYAEFENLKKRAARDHSEQLRFGNEQLLKELLPVLDNLERALAHMKSQTDLGSWLQGVELTQRQWLEVLKKVGVVPIPGVGEPFDPNLHQAVTYLDTTEHPENHVAEELQRGYLLHDRVLRPSMVAVARRPSSRAETATMEDSGPGEES